MSETELPRLCAFAAGRIFDGEKVWADHAVLVENGLVLGLVPSQSVPAEARLWNEPGCTILPGLIDTHAHFMRWQGPLYLANGVTTIRDTGNTLDWILERRKEWKHNRWPRILCMGPLLDGPAPVHPIVSRSCASIEAALAGVRETAAAGVDGIKLYVGMDTAWLPAMTGESHAAGRKVSMHCGGGGVLAAGKAGVDEFYHLDGVLADVWPDHPAGWLELWGLPEFDSTWDRQRRLADSLLPLGMTATPTLAYWDSQYHVRLPGFENSAELRRVPPVLVGWRPGVSGSPSGAGQWQRALEAAQRFVGLLLERGMPVLAGSDTPCGPVSPGVSLWRELALLAEAGMPPEQTLRAATSAAAAFMGRPELGRLAGGSAADLVFVRGNPLEQIPGRPEVTLVVQSGQVHRPEDLLATASTASLTLQDDPDPWAMQFKMHWERTQWVWSSRAWIGIKNLA